MSDECALQFEGGQNIEGERELEDTLFWAIIARIDLIGSCARNLEVFIDMDFREGIIMALFAMDANVVLADPLDFQFALWV